MKEDKNKQACAFLNKQTNQKIKRIENHPCLRFIYLNYLFIYPILIRKHFWNNFSDGRNFIFFLMKL